MASGGFLNATRTDVDAAIGRIFSALGETSLQRPWPAVRRARASERMSFVDGLAAADGWRVSSLSPSAIVAASFLSIVSAGATADGDAVALILDHADGIAHHNLIDFVQFVASAR